MNDTWVMDRSFDTYLQCIYIYITHCNPSTNVHSHGVCFFALRSCKWLQACRLCKRGSCVSSLWQPPESPKPPLSATSAIARRPHSGITGRLTQRGPSNRFVGVGKSVNQQIHKNHFNERNPQNSCGNSLALLQMDYFGHH